MSLRIAVCMASAGLSLIGWLGSTPLFAACDSTAPALTAFAFSPMSIDTTLTAKTVSCDMTLIDALSGVTGATCRFSSPDGHYVKSCSVSAPATGTPQNGIWSCVVTFPRFAQSGVWIASLTAVDGVGNSASIDPSTGGFPSLLTIASDPDLGTPALTAFSLTPATVNVSTTAQTATCNMTVSDAKSGVAKAECVLIAPDSQQFALCAATAPSSGDRNNGVFSCVVSIPRYADAGTWTPQVYPFDMVDNAPSPGYTPPATLTVTSVPEDVVEPSLTSFDFNPKSVSVGAGQSPVVCTIGVADSPAGVKAATCTLSISAFVPPASFISQTHSCTATAPVSGSRNSGTFQCTVIMPRNAAAGAWSSDVRLDDLIGNSVDVPRALTLGVDCATGDPETSCRFAADRQSLTWHAVAGATQYNVYRGPLTNLVDTNADHLPDGGYGTCQNSRDASLTDTTFLDTDVPTPAQRGLFYLIDYKSGGVEKGLGTNSFGTARSASPPCP